MDEVLLSKMSIEQKKNLAVSYLIRNEAERPEATKALFGKLVIAEGAAANTSKLITQTEESLNELGAKFNQIIGSLQTITEFIGEELSEDMVTELCAKYELPNKMPPMHPNASLPGNRMIATPGEGADMAGITTK